MDRLQHITFIEKRKDTDGDEVVEVAEVDYKYTECNVPCTGKRGVCNV